MVTVKALKDYIQLNIDGLKDSIIEMLSGSSVEIDTGVFKNDMSEFHSRDEVLTLLVHLGYLAYDQEKRRVSVPNKEVAAEFIRSIQKIDSWFEVDFFYGAPVVIIVSASEKQMAPCIGCANAACVIENMLLAATDAGLDNIYLWGGVQALGKNADMCAKMGIPEGFKPVSAAAIGYSKSGSAQPRELSVSLEMNYI